MPARRRRRTADFEMNRSIIIGERNGEKPKPELIAHIADRYTAQDVFDALEVGHGKNQFKWLELHRIGKGRGKNQGNAKDYLKGTKNA